MRIFRAKKRVNDRLNSKNFPAKKLKNIGLKKSIIFGWLGGKYTRIFGTKKRGNKRLNFKIFFGIKT